LALASHVPLKFNAPMALVIEETVLSIECLQFRFNYVHVFDDFGFDAVDHDFFGDVVASRNVDALPTLYIGVVVSANGFHAVFVKNLHVCSLDLIPVCAVVY